MGTDRIDRTGVPGIRAARAAFKALAALAIALAALAPAMSAQATAAEFDAGSYSYNELTTGEDGRGVGWNGNVISDLTEEKGFDAKKGGETLLGGFTKLSSDAAPFVLGIFMTIALARFAGRGLWELAFDHGENAEPPAFLKPGLLKGKKSSNRGGDSDWFVDMVKETLVVGIVVVGVWMFLGVIVGIISLVFNQVITPEAANTGADKFTVGDISVQS